MATFGDIFKDKLDTVLDLAIADKFQEVQSERSEGPTELANPQVITQPVYRSQYPGGQPQPVAASGPSTTILLLIGGGMLALFTIVVLLVRG